MESRFTFKDFVFVAALLVVTSAVMLAMWQYRHTETRVDELRREMARTNAMQERQTVALEDLAQALQNGVTVSTRPATTNAGVPTTGTTTTGPATSTATTGTAETLPPGAVRRKEANGDLYVYYPQVPLTPHDPRRLRGYAQGDWLVTDLPSEPKVISPYLEKDAYGSQVQGPVLESLISRNLDTLEWEPYLAESYTQKADGLTYRFVLRERVAFSDGVPMTADDVVFSFQTVLTPGIDCDRYRASIGQVKDVRKIDARTVEFVFKETYFQALETAGGLGIIPKHVYEFKTPKEFNERPATLIGSGPYMLDKWERGQQITLVRNPTYWGPKPTFDRQVFRIIVNQQAAFQAFMAEEIDEFTPLPEQYEKFAKDLEFLAKFKAYNFPIPNGGYRYIGYNLTKPMFKDKLTRQALTMLLDRDAIIKTIQRGMAIKITGPFSPLSKQCDATIQPWPYDPAAARKKLKEAGWDLNGENKLVRDGQEFKFDLTIPASNPIYEKLSAYIKEQWAKAGIDVNVTPFEFSVMVERLDNRNFDAAILGWTGGIEEDPYQIWHSESIKDKGSNFVSFSNPEADKLIVEGRREMDEQKRLEIWHKLHRILWEEQPYTFLSAAMERAFIHGRFQNTEPYKTGLNSGDWYVPKGQQKYR